jgi:antitoxin MazE
MQQACRLREHHPATAPPGRPCRSRGCASGGPPAAPPLGDGRAGGVTGVAPCPFLIWSVSPSKENAQRRWRAYNVITTAGLVVVRAKLVKIGNSRGIRLAKPLLEVAGLADEVEIEAAPGVLTIRPSAHPRAGWAEAAASFEPEGLLDEMSATQFDDQEWSW